MLLPALLAGQAPSLQPQGGLWEDGSTPPVGGDPTLGSQERLIWVKENASFCGGVQGPKARQSQSPWFLGAARTQQGPSPATVPECKALLETKGSGGLKLLCISSSLGKRVVFSIPTRLMNASLIRHQLNAFGCPKEGDNPECVHCSLCAASLWLPRLPKITPHFFFKLWQL